MVERLTPKDVAGFLINEDGDLSETEKNNPILSEVNGHKLWFNVFGDGDGITFEARVRRTGDMGEYSNVIDSGSEGGFGVIMQYLEDVLDNIDIEKEEVSASLAHNPSDSVLVYETRVEVDN